MMSSKSLINKSKKIAEGISDKQMVEYIDNLSSCVGKLPAVPYTHLLNYVEADAQRLREESQNGQ